jgi:quercetin dioxygenase-like cupin family protein
MGLVKFFKVGLTDLVPAEAPTDDIVVRSDERRHLDLASEHLDIALLAPDTRRSMMPLLSTFAPGGMTANHTAHEGEEFVLVIQGRLVLELEGSEPITLNKGDSAYFEASRAHRYINVARGTSKAFAVISPPSL